MPFNLLCQKQNSNWLFGFIDTLYNENCEVVQWMDRENITVFKYIDTPLNFETTMASISDTSGNLLLYSNGIGIADEYHKIIKNGLGLNPGDIYDLSKNTGYVVPNGAMFIPTPGTMDEYFLFHLGARFDDKNNVKYGPFYYTSIKKGLNGFEVVEKNHILIDEDIESFAVNRHGNGKDWWIFLPEYNKNKFYRFLLDSAGIHAIEPQFIGIELPDSLCKISGLSNFSPDGYKYLRFNRSCGYNLYDFDRCSGFLSNPIFESVGYFTPDLAADFIFSDDSKFIYISKLNHYYYQEYYQCEIFKVEINKIGVKAEPYVKLVLSPYVRINRFYRDSKGKIYAFNSFSDDKIHDIAIDKEKPNYLNIYSYYLPATNARTAPYFANFNLEKCECSTNLVNHEIDNDSLIVSPNPFSDKFDINLPPKFISCVFSIYNINGQKIHTTNILGSKNTSNFDFSFMESGIYIFEFDFKEYKQFTKVIKI